MIPVGVGREDVGDTGAERTRALGDEGDLGAADAGIDRDGLAVRNEEQRRGLPERALEPLEGHRRVPKVGIEPTRPSRGTGF